MLRTIAAAAIFTVAVSPPASAALVWDFSEVAGNVVGTMSGSLNTTGLVLLGAYPKASSGGVVPFPATVVSGLPGEVDRYDNAIAVPMPFGPSSTPSLADATTGNLFVMSGDYIGLPVGYTSGSPLSGTLTFLTETFASMGITPGTYVSNLQADTITLNFGPASAVPVPAALPLFGTALAGLGVFGWRRRNAA